MRQQQMTRLIHSLPQLTHHQRQQLASSLQALLDHSQSIAVVETHNCAPRACPHCSNSLLVKNGSANGLQRFKVNVRQTHLPPTRQRRYGAELFGSE